MEWITAADIRRQLQSYWERGHILAAPFHNEQLFPLSLHVKRPDAQALSQRFDEVRTWIKDLEAGSKIVQGFGYEIQWTEINHRALGRNKLPVRVVIPTEDDLLRLIGKDDQAKCFRHLAGTTLKQFPALKDWLARKPLTAIEYSNDWDRILLVLAWFRDHPRPGLYLRQLDIPGVDTKFIESRTKLLSELLDIVLDAQAVETAAKHFEQRYGLLSKPLLVRFRLLDKNFNLHGFSDLTVPAPEFARLGFLDKDLSVKDLPVKQVFITENDVNGLAFPDVANSLVIFGLGYGLERLAAVEWLRGKTLYYWGDIDTHGFVMLNRLRSAWPHVQSFLMDRETLMAHRVLWVKEDAPSNEALNRLTPSEQAVYDDLRYNQLGEQVRLEQERISFGWLKKTLQTLTLIT
jgi:hypothetical protein